MQFDVYKNRSAAKERFPYLLDVQVGLLDALETRVVIPLALKESFEGKILSVLSPVLEVKGKEYVALTSQLAGVAKRDLGSYVVSAAQKRQEIIAAIDFLFTGV
ncbi:MAG: CcdB family protein [Thermaceae bacterium]|nr:CcdB family protein [Thermaceae bacterium]